MSQLRLTTTADLLRFQMRTALSMEHDSLAALEELSGAARSRDAVELLRVNLDQEVHTSKELEQKLLDRTS